MPPFANAPHRSVGFWFFLNMHMRVAPQRTSAAAQTFMDQQVSINKVVDGEYQAATIYLGKLT